MVIMVE